MATNAAYIASGPAPSRSDTCALRSMGAGLHDACGAESERRYDFAEDQRVVARVEQQVDLKHKHKHKRKHVNRRAGRGRVSAAQPTGPHVMQAAEIRALQQHHELRQRLKHDVVVPVWQHSIGAESPRWARGRTLWGRQYTQ